jgi:hypothetical protein
MGFIGNAYFDELAIIGGLGKKGFYIILFFVL